MRERASIFASKLPDVVSRKLTLAKALRDAGDRANASNHYSLQRGTVNKNNSLYKALDPAARKIYEDFVLREHQNFSRSGLPINTWCGHRYGPSQGEGSSSSQAVEQQVVIPEDRPRASEAGSQLPNVASRNPAISQAPRAVGIDNRDYGPSQGDGSSSSQAVEQQAVIPEDRPRASMTRNQSIWNERASKFSSLLPHVESRKFTITQALHAAGVGNPNVLHSMTHGTVVKGSMLYKHMDQSARDLYESLVLRDHVDFRRSKMNLQQWSWHNSNAVRLGRHAGSEADEQRVTIPEGVGVDRLLSELLPSGPGGSSAAGGGQSGQVFSGTETTPWFFREVTPYLDAAGSSRTARGTTPMQLHSEVESGGRGQGAPGARKIQRKSMLLPSWRAGVWLGHSKSHRR
ncbi:MAG TPA: hypothetical protein VFP68_10570 [Burkholderiaceae bacterium]|nr:hypothetical protein [Burkholderiaceae bacterium]